MEAVRQIRKERGLSQQALSELAGINKVTLVHIETGKSSPNVDTLEKLARALEVEVADFFPKAEPSLFSPEIVSPEQGRREPTPYELGAIEVLRDYCDRLDEFLDAAERTKIADTLWYLEADTILNMAGMSLPLVERESTRRSLQPVTVRLLELADKIFDHLAEAEAKHRRNAIREWSKQIKKSA